MKLLKMAKVPPPTVDPDASVLDAVNVMARERVGAVAVASKFGGGVLQGIFTERDLMLRVVNVGRDPRSTKVREVMTSEVKTAAADSSAARAMSVMVSHHLRHLPIVGGGGEVLGILSIRDMLENKVEDLSQALDSMEQYMANDGPGG